MATTLPPDFRLAWRIYQVASNPMEAVRHFISNKATGQIILNLSQGTVCAVEWREKVKEPSTTPPVENSP